MQIELTVNGSPAACRVTPAMSLLELLRDGLGLTGTKQGCGQGHCGCCTVLLEGSPVNACLVLAPAAAGKRVETIDNRDPDPVIKALQRAFVEEGAVQCGFCTPGMLLTAAALLRETPRPEPAAIREALSGNLCRCTGYQRIVAAVSGASDRLAEDSE